MAKAALTISSKNYSSWSLRGWLLAKFAGLDFKEVMVPPDDADARKEILLLSPSILVPCLTHDGIKVWDTLAIAEYLSEVKPKRALPRRLRGNAFRVLESSFGAADESQARLSGSQGVGACAGRYRAHHDNLARLPCHLRRSLPVRQAFDRRRDVRAGRYAVRDLRREDRQEMRGLRLAYPGHAGDGRMDRGGQARARGNRRAGHGVLSRSRVRS